MLYTFRLKPSKEGVEIAVYDQNGSKLPDETYPGNYEHNEEIYELLEKTTGGQFDALSRKAGGALFNMLFDRGAQEKFRGFYGEADDEERRIRVDLEMDETRNPDVVALPWEFLYLDADKVHNLPAIRFAADDRLTFCRYRSLNPRQAMPEPGTPLKIAIFATVPIHDSGTGKELPRIFTEALWTRIRDQLFLEPSADTSPENGRDTNAKAYECWQTDDVYSIHVRFYRQITCNALKAAIKEFHPHMVHFIGHGELREMGSLLLLDETEKKYAEPCDADVLAEAFGSEPPPHVVLLHACEGAASSVETKGFSSVASHILQRGVTTVVAMQYKIQNIDALDFAEQLYEKIFRNEHPLTLERAVQEIRQEHKNLLAQPVIYTSVPASCETELFTAAYRANWWFSRLSQEDKRATKYLFSRLTDCTKGNQLVQIKRDTLPSGIAELIRALSNALLIVVPEDGYIQLRNDELLHNWDDLQTWLLDDDWRSTNTRLHRLMAGIEAWRQDPRDMFTASQLSDFPRGWQREHSEFLTEPEHELLDDSREQLVQLRAQEELLARVGSRFGLSWLAFMISLFLVFFVDTEPLPGNPAWRWRTILGFSVPYALFFASGITFGIEAATIMNRREEGHGWYTRAFILIVAALFIWTGFVLFGWLARDEDFSTIALPLLIPSIVLAVSYVLPAAARSRAVQQIFVAGLGTAAALLLSIELVQYGAAVRPSTSHLVLILPTFVGLSAVLPFVWEIALGRWYAHRLQNLEG